MIPIIIYLLFCVWLAYDNAERIADGKRIYHGLNGALHLLAAVILLPDWMASIALLLLVRVVFDWSLNLFRGLSLGYVSPKPKSIIDKLEKQVFGNNGYLPKIIYTIIAICLLIVR